MVRARESKESGSPESGKVGESGSPGVRGVWESGASGSPGVWESGSPGSLEESASLEVNRTGFIRAPILRRRWSLYLTTDERQRLKQLERENVELKRANEILRKASAFFARRSSTAERGDGDLQRSAARRVRIGPICETVEFATPTWVDWTTRAAAEPIGRFGLCSGFSMIGRQRTP